MEFIKNIKMSNQERKDKELKERANSLFQVAEHNGELWITVNNCPVMPTSFLCIDALEAIQKMRELYIQERLSI